MASKTIPWAVIEQLLARKKEDQRWFVTAIGEQSNTITNWKKRGVPRGRSGDVAKLFGTTSDSLLAATGQSNLPYSPPGLVPMALKTESSRNYVSADEIAELVRNYGQSSAEARRIVQASLRESAIANAGNAGSVSSNES
jgi:hypothetical protein